jgi:hypothetical protein
VVLLRRAGEDSTDERGIPTHRGIVLDVAKNKLGPTGEVPATLWLRHTSLWPGVVRPTFNLDGGPVMKVDTTNEEDQPPNEGEPPAWVQQELPAGEEYTHAGGEEAPF